MPKFVGAYLGKFLIRTFRLNPQKSRKKCPKVSKLEEGVIKNLDNITQKYEMPQDVWTGL